ncbi:MAG: hypothetical protein SOR40_06775, partial [Rothia sp. (in: high G+C Gram-positive bacteria)]|nr:hypothetical protein [Rothia sp. (in: high G+C Gram-positive bacteria)]
MRDGELNDWPVLIEYKGYEGKLVKLNSTGQVENINIKDEAHYKNINNYAVNGAVHYANAILHHTNYERIIAIGITGYKDVAGQLTLEFGVYYVGKENHGAGQEVGRYDDLSFLKPRNFQNFVEIIENLHLSDEEKEAIKQRREEEIETNLRRLNNDIYKNEKGISENDRVYLVAASIIATLGVPGKVAPLAVDELRSSTEAGETDGEKVLRKIKSYLSHNNIPTEK